MSYNQKKKGGKREKTIQSIVTKKDKEKAQLRYD